MARTNKGRQQIEGKKKHLKTLKLKKGQNENELGQREEPIIERKPPSILEKKRFLIVCEGKNTEPSYFNGFKLKTATIKAIGEGYNTGALVERAIAIASEENLKGNDYDEIWCVFDKDDFPNADFNNAIEKAANAGMQIAYSNQSFEYWLFLHFNDHQGGKLNRKLCCKKLNQHLKELGLEYDIGKTKTVEKELFELMISKENDRDKKSRSEKAIIRAENIDRKLDNKNPALEESSTKVYLLVKEIVKYL